eukprot:TRINITY_DN91604_c0_g1_i1.p1 TRINITY_DN91604_c0_g1~~TRINITY_DN91604_c0_g1_i1.p1  ORF type:complete len:377 (-),score=49.05 TRINITY_DN91604_c0_g1_i1:21-1151(-)
MGRPGACWRAVACSLVISAGLLVLTSIALAGLRLHGALTLQWWLVLLPACMALGVALLVLTMAVLMWLRLALRLLTGAPLEVEGGEVSLDVIFTTAKTCFLGHGVVTLLFLSCLLLEVKLRWHEQSPMKPLPALYPLMPLVVLGTLHLLVAFFFRRPEADSALPMAGSMTLLSQSIMLVLKLDYFYKRVHFYWILTFLPCWIAYMFVFVFCVHFGVTSVVTLAQARAEESRARGRGEACCLSWHGEKGEDGGSGGTCGDRGQGEAVKPQPIEGSWPETPGYSSRMVIALGCWCVGNCAAQVMLALRLDDILRTPWLAIVVPAFVSWAMLVAFAVEPMASYLLDVRQRLLQPCAIPADDLPEGRNERAPLLPWRNNY